MVTLESLQNPLRNLAVAALSFLLRIYPTIDAIVHISQRHVKLFRVEVRVSLG